MQRRCNLNFRLSFLDNYTHIGRHEGKYIIGGFFILKVRGNEHSRWIITHKIRLVVALLGYAYVLSVDY